MMSGLPWPGWVTARPLLIGEPAIEGDLALHALADARAGVPPAILASADRLDQGLLDLGQIFRVGDRGFLIGQPLDQRRGMIVLAAKDPDHRPGRVRMRGADQDRRVRECLSCPESRAGPSGPCPDG